MWYSIVLLFVRGQFAVGGQTTVFARDLAFGPAVWGLIGYNSKISFAS
jgi:hypothetical protein